MKSQGLTAITIENFKGIGQAVTIPLRPVTLLFGANSAGKSTIIQALQYAWEILENRNADVDRTRLGGEVIDLGGFQNLVHGHDLSRSISITLHYSGSVHDRPYWPPEFYSSQLIDFSELFGADNATATNWVDISNLSVRITSAWEHGDGPYIAAYEVGLNGVLFGGMEQSKSSMPRLMINGDHPFFAEEALASYSDYGAALMGAIFSQFGDPSEIVRRFIGRMTPEMRTKIQELFESHEVDHSEKVERQVEADLADSKRRRFLVESVVPEWGKQLDIERVGGESDDEWRSASEELTWVLSQLLIGAGEAILRDLRRLRYLGPLRAVPERTYASPLQLDSSRWANGLGAWDSLLRSKHENREEPSLIERCNHYLNEVLGLGYTVRRDSRIQLPDDSTILSELRLFAAQYDERDGAELLRRVLEPLERLPRIAALQLHDEKRDIDIEPMDIGVGVSQTLPVIVGAVEPNCTIFAVEQPELHIHPAVQSRMGDLFLQECLDTPGRIFLLETHSEHLMLRMLRRIRETADGELPPGYPRVTPEDVQVLYVESEGGVTSIVPLPITEDGDFAEKWPHGFFTEREEDLF